MFVVQSIYRNSLRINSRRLFKTLDLRLLSNCQLLFKNISPDISPIKIASKKKRRISSSSEEEQQKAEVNKSATSSLEKKYIF
jgi:hypothetical protein